MTVWIDNRLEELEEGVYDELIHHIIRLALEEEEYPANTEVSVSLVNNEEIQKINKQFRNQDKPTDVLSFPMLGYEEDETGGNMETEDLQACINQDTKELVLGDIIISVPKAYEQAEEYGHSIEREIAFLTAHSMFHLMGYDHMTDTDEEIMQQKQEAVLRKAGLGR